MFSKIGILLTTLYFACCCAYFSLGQTLNFEQFTNNDGLPSTECYKVIQDQKGYIWVFSEFGIVKHNGDRFVSVCTNLKLQDQNAYAVFETDEGSIYFSNSNGKIFKIKNDSALVIKAIETYTKSFTDPQDVIFQLAVDKNDDIYFSSYEASYHYKAATGSVEVIAPIKRAEVNHLMRYKPFGNEFLSLRSTSNLRQANDEIQIELEGKIFAQKIKIPRFYDPGQLKKWKDSYLVACSTGIYQLRKEGLGKFIEVENVLRIFIDKQDQIWVGTSTGLILIDSNLRIVGKYLVGVVVSDICVDQNGGLWVTTIGDGVYFCKNKNLVSYSNTVLKEKEIFGLKKSNNSIFVTTTDGSCYERKNKNFTLLHDFKEPVFCGDISVYKEGHLFSTKNGIFYKARKAPIQELLIQSKGSLYSNKVQVVGKDEFLSFGGASISIFNNDTVRQNCHVGSKFYSYAPYGGSRYLIGTKNGLFIYDYKDNKSIPFHDFFSEKFVRKIVYDSGGNLWISTQSDGLYILTKEDELIQYGESPSLVVKDIDFFGKSYVILSTNLGVYVSNFRQKKNVRNWINIFEGEVNEIEVSDGNIWIASKSGLYSMALSSIELDKSYPIYINSIYGKVKRLTENFTDLSYKENDLRFNFDFLNYRSKVTFFHFKLNGPTELSGIVSGNVLQIQNLKPGAYHLKVSPYNGMDYKENQFITKSFIIHPAFWQTTWFKFLVYALAILLSGSFVGIFYHKKNTREKKRNEINHLLAEYKLIALKAQINPHFISNSLSAIQLLIDSEQVEKANLYVAKFGLLMRYVLTFSDKSVTKLSDELKVIDLLIELEQLRFTHEFSFIKEIGTKVDVENLYLPPLITQPFIENAIWHGLIPLKGTKPAELKMIIERCDEFLTISIIDNGVGRKETENNAIKNRESRGTSIIQQRIDNLNQLYDTTVAELNIIDLYDNVHHPIGTRVELKLPISLLSKLEEKLYESNYS